MIGLLSSVSNFQVPSASATLVYKCVFTYADNQNQIALSQLANNAVSFIPQGVIIDARDCSDFCIVYFGQQDQFSITVQPGQYLSYMIPAYVVPYVTVVFDSSGDTLTLTFTNFPIVPQNYNPTPTPIEQFYQYTANQAVKIGAYRFVNLTGYNLTSTPYSTIITLNKNFGLEVLIPSNQNYIYKVYSGNTGMQISSFDFTTAPPSGVLFSMTLGV